MRQLRKHLHRPWVPAVAGITVFVGIYVFYWSVFYFDKEAHRQWFGRPVERGAEDKLIEWIGFAGFFAAGLFMLAALRFRECMGHRWLVLTVLGAGVFYLVCAGEEISWGQRVFGWETPEAFKEINQQDETNLHNLDTGPLHPKDVVSWWMKLYGIFLPIAFWWFCRGRDQTLRWSVASLSLVPLFVYVEFFNKLERPLRSWAEGLEDRDIWRLIKSQHEEIMEMYWGLCVAFAAAGAYLAWRQRARLAASTSPHPEVASPGADG